MTRPVTKSTRLHPAIHEMLRRVVAGFDPEQIVLFGSYATGKHGPDSDADLLIVMDLQGPKRPTVMEMHRLLADAELAKDLVIVTPDELARGRHEPGSLVHTALKEGRVLYDRPGLHG